MAKKQIQQKQQMDTIVLNKMFAGDKYLSSNLGHEIINFFQADDDNYYLYLLADGKIGKDRANDNFKCMIYVKPCDYSDGVQVIGLARRDNPAENLINIFLTHPDKKGQDNFCSNISYGGVNIKDLFKGDMQQDVFITFKAEKVYVPTHNIFIHFGSNNKSTSTDIYLTVNQGRSRRFIVSTDNDYTTLTNELINKKDLWKELTNSKISDQALQLHKQKSDSLIDICRIQDNENCFSNALAFFVGQQKYYPLWESFFKQYGISLLLDITIEREKSIKDNDKIDLYIEDYKNIIVIENKIKAVESKNNKGIGQLERYYVDVESIKGSKRSHYFILAPNYNPIANQKAYPINVNNSTIYYTIITYKGLYDFLDKYKELFANDTNFVAFFEAMKRHTYPTLADSLYNEMKDKFFNRIKERLNNRV